MTQPRTVHGVAIPTFLYGTAWKEERTEALTRTALDTGFRGVDTANQRKHYVEAGAGDAVQSFLRDSGQPRSALFLQTKFTYARGQDHRLPYDPAATPAQQVAQSFQSSLEHLHTDYLDAYLLHGPSHGEGISRQDWEVWHAMSELQRAGRTRLIGVSNVSLAQLRALHEAAEVKPMFVQNRCYARSGWDHDVRAFCRAHDIVYQGFSLLTANRHELASSSFRRLHERHGCTAAQLTFRFALHVGMLPLTGTSDRQHMQEDLQSEDVTLSDEEIATIERVGLV